MRELKFRAWVGSENTNYIDLPMHYEYDDITLVNGKYADVESGWDIHGTYENVPIEQYTGLKDKNGKEIYEGDILTQTLIDDPFTKKYPTYVVCWDEEFLSWALKDVSGDDGNDTDLHFFIEEWKKCEVICNIHENKELLERRRINER